MEVGSYAHRPILYDPEEIPSIEQATLSPTELPFTSDDFDLQLEQALELMPDILGNPAVGIRLRDQRAALAHPGRRPGPRRVAGRQGPVVGGRGLDQGGSRRRPHGRGVDGRRHARDRPALLGHRPLLPDPAHPRAHPGAHQRGVQQDLRHRAPVRAVGLGPGRAAQPDARRTSASSVRCSSRPPAGSGRSGTSPTPPCWTGTATPSCRASAEWDARWWSPIINAEHLAMREGGRAGRPVGVQHLRRRSDPARWRRCSGCAVAQMDVAVGRVVYTPVLNAAGGIRSDLTIMRLGDDHFRVVTGGVHGNADRKWFADHAPADGSAQVVDQTNAFTTIGLWGPNARDILESVTRADVSHEAFPFGTCREIEVGSQVGCSPRGSPTSASSAGSCTSRSSRAHGCGDAALRGGPASTAWSRWGSASTAPPAASRRATARTAPSSTSSARSPRPGWRARSSRTQDFVGKAALPRAVRAGAGHDPVHAHRGRPHVRRRRAALHARPRAGAHRRRRRRSPTSAGTARTSPRPAPRRRWATHLLMTYLPPEYAVEGTKLSVEYMAERYPCTVARVGAMPLFDPDNDRIRG